MKKLICSMFALAMTAMTFVSCEDVPMPYTLPTDNGGKTEDTVAATGTGTQADPYNVAAAVKLIKGLEAGVQTETAIYVKGKVKSFASDYASAISGFGNANYYITDDGNNELYIFQSYYLGGAKFTSADQLKEGDEVVIYGKFVNYKGNTPETVGKGASHIYSLNGKTSSTNTPTVTEEQKGDGTLAKPYNPAAAYVKASSLDGEGKIENVYVSGIVSKVEVSTQYGNATYTISEDGKTTGTQFSIYRGLYLEGAKFTSADQLKVGQKVVVLGTLVNYMGNTPQMTKDSKLISVEGEGTTPEADDEIAVSSFGLGNTTDWGTQTMADGTKIIADKGTGSNVPKYYSASNGTIRMYPGNSLTFEATKKIESIVFTCDSSNGTNYTAEGKVTVTSGTVALNDLVFTISGINNTKVTITNSNTATGGKTQLRIKSFKIVYAK
jgi:hypothetical protein